MLSTIRVLVLVLFASAATAAESFDLRPYREANARFLELLAAGEGGVAKDLRTPEFARLVTLMSDEKRFLRAKAFTQADMPDVMDLCDMANRNDMGLLFFGVKSRIDAKWSDAEKVRKLTPLIEQNSIDFQPELTTLQPFHIRCMGLGMPLLEDFVRALPPDQMTPVRRGGLTKMRNGYTEMISGMLMNIGDMRLSTRYRAAVVEAMADAAPALASVFNLSQRARLLGIVEKSEPTMPREFKTSRERIQRALQDSECSVLCAF
jgi:hypothetical protein